jgi:diacylglycerol kinase (ATP)
MLNTLLIINPTAGKVQERNITDSLCQLLNNLGKIDVFLTTARGDAEVAAKDAVSKGTKRVIAVGGDGTLNEVVNGLAASDVQLGIIPLGTANVLARELVIPVNDIDGAVEVINNGNERRIDLGRAGDRFFAAMAGFGIDAAVVHSVVPEIKKLIGPGAYVIAGAESLLKEQPARFHIALDGKAIEVEAYAVLVANSAKYAYGVKVASHASVDDGMLDVMVFGRTSPAKIGLLHQAVKVLLSTHTSDPNIRYYRAKQVVVKSEPDVLMQLDGDEAGRTPITVEIVPKCLCVLVP